MICYYGLPQSIGDMLTDITFGCELSTLVVRLYLTVTIVKWKKKILTRIANIVPDGNTFICYLEATKGRREFQWIICFIQCSRPANLSCNYSTEMLTNRRGAMPAAICDLLLIFTLL